MEWIILFIVSWILFILLVDLKKLKRNIWGGILAVALQYSIDTNAMVHELYKINNPVIAIKGSSLFFILGPVIVIGTLLAQFHPQKKIFIIMHIIILAALYSLQEIFLLMTEVLEYLNWHFYDSVVVNIAAMTLLSWFSLVVLGKRMMKV